MRDVENLQEVGGVGRERGQVAEHVVEVLAVAADGDRQLLLPDAEGSSDQPAGLDEVVREVARVAVDLRKQRAAGGHRGIQICPGRLGKPARVLVLRRRSEEHVLQSPAGRAVERVEQLVEVDGAGGLGRGDDAVVGDRGSVRRPQSQIDVAVGDARQRDRANRGGGPFAQGLEGAVVDLQRQLRLTVWRQSDVRHRPDLVAGHLDQVAGDDLARVLKDRPNLVGGPVRQHDHGDRDQRHDERRHRGHPADHA